MKKRQLTHTLIVVIGTLLLFTVQAFLKKGFCDKKLVQSIEDQYQSQERLANHWLSQEDLWFDISANGFNCSSAYQLYQTALPLFLLSRDSILYWNTASISIPEGYSTGLPKQLHRLPNQHYNTISHLLPNGLMAVALITIDAKVSTKIKGGIPIYNQNREAVAYIDQKSLTQSTPICSIWLLIVELCILSGLVFITDYSLTRLLSDKLKKEIVSISAFVCFALIIYWIGNIEFPHVPFLNTLGVQQVGGLSLLQWLCISTLSIWLLSLLQRIDQRYLPYIHYPPKLMVFSIYLSINLGILATTLLIKDLVKNSKLNYDFQNIVQLGVTEIVCLIAILVLLSSHFFYSLWAIGKVHNVGIKRNTKLVLISLSVVVATSIAFILNTQLSIILFGLVLILFVALLDLFVERNAGSPAWLILWLALLTAFTSGLFFKYHLDIAHDKRIFFAKQISTPRDSTIEQMISGLLLSDLCTDDCRLQMDSSIESIPYLQKNYSWSIDYDNPFSDSIQVPLPGQFVHQKANTYFINYSFAVEEEKNKIIYIHLTPKTNTSQKTLDGLIPSTPFLLSDYDFAILYKGQVVAQKGYIDKRQLAFSISGNPTNYREEVSSQSAITYFPSHSTEAYEIVVTEKLGGYLKPISLFSYLFALLAIIILFLSGLNHYISIFPARPGTQLFGKPSLRHRIQLATIGVTLVAFIFACTVTVIFLQNTWESLQSQQMKENVNSVLRALSLTPEKDAIDKRELHYVSETQQVDISLYNQDGRLIVSTFPYLYKAQLRSSLLSPQALFSFYRPTFLPNIIYEKIPRLGYFVATVPVKASKDANETQFISITFSSQQEAFREKMLSFIGYLLNLYVFLLLIASATAIAIAKSITNPLSKLDEKLRSFKLGENLPLEWNSQDEIGQLISAYNDMIKALDISTEKLKQSERENAWREMAKQVAHEIKNPLTPMKLSIQYLNHAQRTDPSKARELIEKVSKTLVEQIDGLAHIATAFSNFAKMPKATLAPISINDTLQSIHQLFSLELSNDFELQLTLPKQEAVAMADQKQLIRVFNNLIKNAQQAIPHDRTGHIKTSLSIESSYALIEIKDNGTGIPPEVQPNVFQPNFTTKSSGMGLGLAMCKNIIESANGSIYFTTTPNAGTSFFVKLPLYYDSHTAP